jgi:hypothetical protein
MKNPPFTPDQFIPTQWDTADQKARFANQFVRFVESGFKRTLFPKWFYQRLSNCFMHIAYYNIHGFYAEWFETTRQQIEFLEHTQRSEIYGDSRFTYCDVERALQVWLTEHAGIGIALRNQLAAAVQQSELNELARLQSKYQQPIPLVLPPLPATEPVLTT